jgi:hypothetical protein
MGCFVASSPYASCASRRRSSRDGAAGTGRDLVDAGGPVQGGDEGVEVAPPLIGRGIVEVVRGAEVVVALDQESGASVVQSPSATPPMRSSLVASSSSMASGSYTPA